MADLKRLEAIPASQKALRRTENNRRVVAPLTRAALRTRGIRMTVEGAHNVPRTGPAIVIANHVGFYDPAQLIIVSKRCIHFMATAGTMRDPKLGRVMRLFGAIPKKKGVTDASAIRGMRAWTGESGVVGIFPEGERTWDGRPLPFLPGIERLVRMLKVPLVTARIHNADRVTPRWADRLRRGRIHVEFDEPVQFAPREKPEVIRAHIERAISIDVEALRRFPAEGRRLARGLSNLLYACPDCGLVDGLAEHDEELECRGCAARWAVTSENLLVRGDESLAVWSAAARIDERFAEDQADIAGRGTPLLSSSGVRVLDSSGDVGVEVARGTLTLTPERLFIEDSDWGLNVSAIGSVPIDLARRLQVIGRDGLMHEFEIPLHEGSVLKWKRALDRLVARVSGPDA